MRIGIDAKWYFEGPPSGKIVVQNLLENLITLFPQHQFYLFLDSRFQHQYGFFNQENVKTIFIWGKVNLISNTIIVPLVAKKYKLDAVVFQNFNPLFSNFKSITYIHDIIFKTNPKHFTFFEKLYFSPMRHLSKRAHAIVTISENEKKRLIEHDYGKHSTIKVIYNGISSSYSVLKSFPDDVVKFVKNKYCLPEKFLLYVGRLNARKNLKNLINALNLMSNNSIPLLLFGAYDWKSFDIDEFVNIGNLQGRVFRKGFADQQDLPIIYALATVFTFVSYDEGFGLPPLEAMASGVPVVVSNRASLYEVCGSAGNYVNPDDPQEIAEMIDCLLDDRSLYDEKRKLGLEQAQKFSWEKSAKELLHLIESL